MPSSNTNTFVSTTLSMQLKQKTKSYVCLCESCEFSRNMKFMKYYERKNKINENKNRFYERKKLNNDDDENKENICLRK